MLKVVGLAVVKVVGFAVLEVVVRVVWVATVVELNGFVRFQKGAAENPPPFHLASFAAFRSIVARSSA